MIHVGKFEQHIRFLQVRARFGQSYVQRANWLRFMRDNTLIAANDDDRHPLFLFFFFYTSIYISRKRRQPAI